MHLNTIDLKKKKIFFEDDFAWDECCLETLPTLLTNPQQPPHTKKTGFIYLLTFISGALVAFLFDFLVLHHRALVCLQK